MYDEKRDVMGLLLIGETRQQALIGPAIPMYEFDSPDVPRVTERKIGRPSKNLIVSLVLQLVLGVLAALGTASAVAQATSNTTTVAPLFFYNYGDEFISTSLAAAAAYGNAEYVAQMSQYPQYAGWTFTLTYSPQCGGCGTCSYPACSENGLPDEYRYIDTYCPPSGVNCGVEPLFVYLQPACPVGFTPPDFSYSVAIVACTLTVSNVQPPPKNCRSCFGNPIYAATGQKMQVETDYSDASGLNFIRTYRSNNGFFASVLTQAFADGSATAGTVSTACYPAAYATYFNGNTVAASGSYCFPYISTGVQQYQLATEDGRSIGFSGPNTAITANADINERVTKLTVNGATEWQVHRDDDTIELYNAAGSLIQKTLRGGRTFTYSYSTSSTPASIAPTPGLLLSESDAFGHSLSWQYNSAGQMTQMTDPAGNAYIYNYDSSGNLSGVKYPDGTSKTYWYNESAYTGGANLPTALTGITDESGVRYAIFQYNSSGWATNTQHAGGVDSYTFNYSTPGSNTTVTDPLGTSRSYAFQQSLSYDIDSSQTQPAAVGGTTTQSETYDANGNPQSVTDYDGNVTHYVYDLTRNLETSRTEAYGTAQARTITTQWNSTWRQPSLITEPNRTTSFQYDSLGNLHIKTITDLTVTPNVTRTWTYIYDSYGRIQSVQGPRGNGFIDKVVYSYYTCTTGAQCGEVETFTNQVNQITTFNTYTATGQPHTITDPNGTVTTLGYDLRHRLNSSQVGTETTRYNYWPTGLLETVTQPDSSTISYSYDAAHRLTQITDTLGNYVKYTLDAMGNRTGEATYDSSGTKHRDHTRQFNTLSQLSEDINAANTGAVTTSYGYDNQGNQTTIDAPLARNTVKGYDALNRLSKITDPASGITYLGYDANDNLASVEDPRTFTTSYSHNGFNDLTKLVSPDTGTTLYVYDSGGNPKTITDARGAAASFGFDDANRLIKLSYSDQVINYTYDSGTNGLGRLTGASDANHSMSWAYDGLGRVTGKGQTVASVTLSVGYGYTNGDLTTLVTPSGQTITYGYTNHQITSIKVGSNTLLSSVTYDPFGPITGWTWGNSTTTTKSFDLDGNPSQIVSAGTTNIYTPDNASRITGITDSGLASDSWTFGYDLLDRVTSGSSTGKSRGYTYDANGNRTKTTGTTASTEAISTTNNQLTSTTGGIVRTYGYDAAGNASFTGETLTFNQRGRMSSAGSGSGVTNYVYNALNQLIEKSGNGGTTILVYDEAGHVLGEYTSAGALVQETIWIGDTPVATLRPNGSTVTIYYVHTDHLGTPRKITNPSTNAIVWRWDPDTFGSSVTPSIATIAYNLRFPGMYLLTESSLYYNYFRTYDPQMGRYVEADPIGLRGGINPYVYSGANPISRIDPFGLAEELPEADETQEERDENTPENLFNEAEAARLQSEIQKLDPGRGSAIPPGYRPSNADIAEMEATLQRLRNESRCRLPDPSKQIKRISNSLIEAMQKKGVDPHDLKPNSKYDIFIDGNGDLVVYPKSGNGPGDPTGYNIRDFLP